MKNAHELVDSLTYSVSCRWVQSSTLIPEYGVQPENRFDDVLPRLIVLMSSKPAER